MVKKKSGSKIIRKGRIFKKSHGKPGKTCKIGNSDKSQNIQFEHLSGRILYI